MNINEVFDNNLITLEFMKNKSKFVAKGSILIARGQTIIVTAAHCVFDFYENDFYKKLYIKHKEIYYKVKKAYIHKEWIEKGVLDYDTAFLILENSEKIENILPISPIFKIDHKQNYFILVNKKSIISKNKYLIVFKNSFEDYLYGSSLKGIEGNTKVGDSGAPWFIEYGDNIYQNSNTSLSFKHNKKIVWGTYWGIEINKIYESIFCEVDTDVVKVTY